MDGLGITQDTTRRLAQLVAHEADGQQVLDEACEALGRTVSADASWLIHFDSTGHITNLALWSGRELSLPLGNRQVISDELRQLRSSGRSYRVETAEIDPDSPFGIEARRLGIMSAVGVPVLLAGQVWGLVVVARFGPERFAGDTEERMTDFIQPVTAMLANAWAGVELEGWHAEQAALRRLTELGAADLRPDEVPRAVVVEASVVLKGRTVILARLEDDRSTGVIVAASDERARVGLRFTAEGDNAASRILRSGRPVRIDDYTPASGGPVAEELGVRAVVAVPVEVEGELWGMLLAASSDEPLPIGSESRLAQFASIAAASIASAQTRESLKRLTGEQAALLRVAGLVARGAHEDELFQAVAVEAGGLVDAETSLVRLDGPRTYTIIASSGGGPGTVGVSVEVPPDQPYVVDEVVRTHRPVRRVDLEIPRVRLSSGRDNDVASNVIVPILVEGRLWGLLSSMTQGHRLPHGTEVRLQQFADLVAAAIANSQARAELQLLADEQAALLRVAELVAHGGREEDLFDAVAMEAAGLIDNEATTLIRYDGERTFTVLATRRGPAEAGTVFSVPADDVGTISEMLRTGRAARMDSDEATPSWTFSEGGYRIRSSVSVPIIVEGELWGSLGTLTALDQCRPLPSNTEARLQKFAELVAAAIANSLARTQVVQLADEQSALRRVAELVARGAALPDVFAGISIEASRLLDDVAAALVRFEAGSAVVVAAHNSPATVGSRIPLSESEVSRLFDSGRAVQPTDLTRSALAVGGRDLGLMPGTAVPITVEGKTWGALTISFSSSPVPPAAEVNPDDRMADKLEKLAALAAAAIANAENRAQLTASRARVVATADETRRRLQRDVHDGAQQRLVQTVLTLKLARAAAGSGQPTDELVEEALQNAERATIELRDLVHGILPASLTRGGLRSGVESLIADIPMSVQLHFSAPRLPSRTEITAYFIVAEALTNVVKHAAATCAIVRIGSDEGRVSIEVSDDGRGGADAALGSGLTGLLDRVETVEGTLTVSSPPGAGTTLRASLPVPLS